MLEVGNEPKIYTVLLECRATRIDWLGRSQQRVMNLVRPLENLRILHLHIGFGQAQPDCLLSQLCPLRHERASFLLMGPDEAHASLVAVKELYSLVGPYVQLVQMP